MSFCKIWPSKSKVKIIAQSHVLGITRLTSYWLISLSSPVNRPSRSWDTAISEINHENTRSMLWVRSKCKVTMWVWHHIHSLPFGSMSIGPPIPEIQYFQNLTLKIQGQGHSSSSQSCYTTYRLISLSSHADRPSHSWDTAISKFDVENSRSMSWVRSKLKIATWVQYSVDSHTFRSCQSGITFMSYDFFKICSLKSRVNVMGEVTVQSHNVGLTNYWLTSLSFHVNRPSHSWDTAFSKFDFENPGSRSMTMMLHNYRSRQCHRTSNSINPFSGFRDMGSAKSDPGAAWFDKFLAHGQAHMGHMVKQPWQCTATGINNSTELRTEKIRQADTPIWVPQVWQAPTAARPPGPWRQYPSGPEGWGVKIAVI